MQEQALSFTLHISACNEQASSPIFQIVDLFTLWTNNGTHNVMQTVQDSDLCLVLLSAKPDSFFLLAEAAQEVERQCKQSGVLQVRLC